MREANRRWLAAEKNLLHIGRRVAKWARPRSSMRQLLPSILAVALSVALPLSAQDAVPHAPDGGTQEQMQSIFVTPAPNAPFSAVVKTEWTSIMPDGSKSTVYNHRSIARDSSGRVFEERRYLTPHGNTQAAPIRVLEYDDPNRHERFVCRPELRVCKLSRLLVPSMPVLQPAGSLPNGAGTLTSEDLGRKSIEGLDATGTREITTLNAGVFGNEKPQPVVKEFWYSPRLQINLVTERFDPRVSSVQNIAVTDVNLTEPDPKLFTPPANYRIIRLDGQ